MFPKLACFSLFSLIIFSIGIIRVKEFKKPSTAETCITGLFFVLSFVFLVLSGMEAYLLWS